MNEKDPLAGRRRLLRNIAAGGGIITTGRILPDHWTRPVVESVVLPAHGMTTYQPPTWSPPSPPSPTPPPGTPDCNFTLDLRVAKSNGYDVTAGGDVPSGLVEATITVTPNPGAGQVVTWTRACAGGASASGSLMTNAAGVATTGLTHGLCTWPDAGVDRETWTFTYQCSKASWSAIFIRI